MTAASIATAFHAAMAWIHARIAVRDVVIIGGLWATAVGLLSIYPPAAWLFVGLFCLWISFRRPSTPHKL